MKRFLLMALVLGAGACMAEEGAGEVTGKWISQFTTPDGRVLNSLLSIEDRDGDLTVRIETKDRPTREMDDASYRDGVLKIRREFSNDQGAFTIGVEAKYDGKGELDGKWFVRNESGETLRSENWKAGRSIDPVVTGTWRVTASTDDDTHEHEIRIRREGAGLAATVEGEDWTSELDKVSVEKLDLILETDMDSGSSIHVRASLESLGVLKGRWELRDPEGGVSADGDWKAELEE